MERLLKQTVAGLFHASKVAALGAARLLWSVGKRKPDVHPYAVFLSLCLIGGLLTGIGFSAAKEAGGYILFGLFLLVMTVLFAPAAALFLLAVGFSVLWCVCVLMKRIFGLK